jgi:signal-transduction protein with cAMP-binding, CBS, and nucleotidyltransferase domain
MRQKTGYTVGDCMTQNPLKTNPKTTVQDCAILLKKNKLGSILVVENNKPVGIVTNQDLVYRVLATGLDLKTQISKIMSKNVILISPDIDIFDALEVMNKNVIRHLTVAKDGVLVGYLTLKDILKIEPTLFDLYVSKIDARLSGDNKLYSVSDEEGICENCGEYSQVLNEVEGLRVCSHCKRELS